MRPTSRPAVPVAPALPDTLTASPGDGAVAGTRRHATRSRVRKGRPDAPAAPEPLALAPGLPPPDALAPRPLVGLPLERDSFAATALWDVVDRAVHASTARVTGGVSPAALMQAWMDWAIHLAAAPGKRMLLAQKAQRKAQRFARYALNCALASTQSAHAGPPRCIEPLAQDKRFASDSWTQWPFNLIHQGFLLNQQFWHNATTGVRGVTPQHENLVQFGARQLLDVFSPSNFPLTNPDVLQKTVESGG